MILEQAFNSTVDELRSIRLEDRHLEAEVLLRHLLGLDRAAFYSDPGRSLTDDELKTLSALIRRRLSHEPSAYIAGYKEFYGLDFEVTPSVLIPRPETELLVEKAICLARNMASSGLTVADVGTGCGAIAVALAANLPFVTIYASDISPGALEIARRNIEHHGLSDRITLFEGNLLDPLPERAGMIVANLPYVRTSDIPRLSPEIAVYEPGLALDGGYDGLSLVRVLLKQARHKLQPGGAILLEIGQGQAERVRRIAAKTFLHSSIYTAADLGGVERVVVIDTCSRSSRDNRPCSGLT